MDELNVYTNNGGGKSFQSTKKKCINVIPDNKDRISRLKEKITKLEQELLRLEKNNRQ